MKPLAAVQAVAAVVRRAAANQLIMAAVAEEAVFQMAQAVQAALAEAAMVQLVQPEQPEAAAPVAVAVMAAVVSRAMAATAATSMWPGATAQPQVAEERMHPAVVAARVALQYERMVILLP